MQLPLAAAPGNTTARGVRARWALYDFAVSAYATVIQTFVFAAYFTREIASDAATGTAAWGYAAGLAGVAVALGGPLLGARLDSAGGHLRALGALTLLGSLATAALWFATPGTALLPVLAAVGVGIVAVELASVPYNTLLPRIAPPDALGRWSGWGWALGYAGGLGCLVVALVAFVRPGWPTTAQATHVRATFVLAAVWMLVFALPLLRARGLDDRGHGRGTLAVLRELGATLRALPRQRGVLWFLLARMLYTDALTTVFAFGGVYAAGTFGMDAGQVLVLGIVLNVTAGLGALAFAPLDDRLGSRRTVAIALAALLASTAVLLAVRTPTQFLIVAGLVGALVGPVQAASRTLLARLAPAETRAQLFGLYAFSGKATAFIGPFLVGALTAVSGSQRAGLAVVLGLLAGGLVLLRGVPEPGVSARAPAVPAPPPR